MDHAASRAKTALAVSEGSRARRERRVSPDRRVPMARSERRAQPVYRDFRGLQARLEQPGAQGIQGVAGAAGAVGAAGAAGVQGAAGAVGADGPAGPPGPAGQTGQTGAQGPPGPRGSDGNTGPAGLDAPCRVRGVLRAYARRQRGNRWSRRSCELSPKTAPKRVTYRKSGLRRILPARDRHIPCRLLGAGDRGGSAPAHAERNPASHTQCPEEPPGPVKSPARQLVETTAPGAILAVVNPIGNSPSADDHSGGRRHTAPPRLG